MKNLRSSLGACGFDPSYEKITVEALKRGRNGDGKPFEVEVTKRTGEYLGIVTLSGSEHTMITDVIDQPTVPYEDRVELLGQRIADILVERLAGQYRQGKGGDSTLYVRV
jgi:hypothetical protein